ncbi:hypothetical protein EYF80_013409 [Liparis tanakae]|uniref:Uncharacterized protein n=1 Tax=Liparis tanakae TaxID=230148 RepID=A0A4Z2IEM5_9TELE|nr:hypothetical protein EYF80_013409 [Liparis tanakae]
MALLRQSELIHTAGEWLYSDYSPDHMVSSSSFVQKTFLPSFGDAVSLFGLAKVQLLNSRQEEVEQSKSQQARQQAWRAGGAAVHQPYPHPSHSNSTTPPPPAPCSGFFFPWIFASHHADGPLALPDGSVFPPPPPAVLLFHSKMASALEPLLCGCIFWLVVVSDSHGFGTFSSAARQEIPVSSSGSRMGEREIFFTRSAFRELPLGNQNRTSSGFLGNRER